MSLVFPKHVEVVGEDLFLTQRGRRGCLPKELPAWGSWWWPVHKVAKPRGLPITHWGPAPWQLSYPGCGLVHRGVGAGHLANFALVLCPKRDTAASNRKHFKEQFGL